ncbi:MAG: hypothetical protein JO100_05085 [Pseudonocardia sp.]|nr:hypothetical protein [Pseudonocardia sp.]
MRPTWAELEYLDQHPEEIEYLVKDTVAEAWVLFRRCAVRGENAWEPTKGTSLTTYFVGTCKLAFQTIFRGWQREMKPRLTESRDSETYAELSADIDLEQQVVSEIIAAEMLDDLPGHIREIITLRLQGRTYTEIAEITGRKSARAVEAELKRYRDKRRGREGGS